MITDCSCDDIAASSELLNVTKSWNQKELEAFGVVERFQWKFTPADAPWQNGISEALIKTIKRTLKLTIGDNILTFSELQTVYFEVANLVNERPIGRHPTSPDDGSYLCQKMTYYLEDKSTSQIRICTRTN